MSAPFVLRSDRQVPQRCCGSNRRAAPDTPLSRLDQNLGEVQRADAGNLQRLIAARNHIRQQSQRVVIEATEACERPHPIQSRRVRTTMI